MKPSREPVASIDVGPDDAGQRLDRVITRTWKLPSSLIHKALRRGWITVDGAKAEANRRLDAGARIVLHDGAGISVDDAEIPPDVAPMTAIPSEGLDARLVFRDGDVAVFDKPGGVPTHGGTGHSRSFQDAARASLRVADGEAATEGSEAGSFIHRLDRDASGLLIYGRSALALRRLSEALREDEIDREYLCLVKGPLKQDKGVIDAPLRKGTGPRARELMVVGKGEGSQPAVTRFRVEKRFGARATLVAVKLETGRKHQIRAHFAHRKHPLLGDPKYGDIRANKEAARVWGLERLFLHAREIRFRHPRTDARFSFQSKLPPELQAVIDRAGGGSKKRRRG